jgi:hypothetical protein
MDGSEALPSRTILIFGGGQFVAAAWAFAWPLPEPAADGAFAACVEFPDAGATPAEEAGAEDPAEVPVAEFPDGAVALQSGATAFFLSRERRTLACALPPGFFAGVELAGDGAGADCDDGVGELVEDVEPCCCELL